eukprot:671325-Pyramimonas_sp.AAC.1
MQTVSSRLPPGNLRGCTCASQVGKWSKLKDSLRPSQTALGYDWVLYKMKNLTTEEAAQAYMDRCGTNNYIMAIPFDFALRTRNTYLTF